MPSINSELGERALAKMQHEIDWKFLKVRVLRQYPTWTKSHVDKILKEYMRFIALKVSTRDIYDTIILAPVLIDAMWQQHILCTQKYFSDCQTLLQANEILHYNPDATASSSSAARAKRVELTRASLCMLFSGMNLTAKDGKGIWDFEEGDTTTVSATLGEATVACDTIETPTNSDSFPADETETETDSPLPPTQFMMNKKGREKSCKGKPSNPTEGGKRLVYIYRAGKVSQLQVYPGDTVLCIKNKIHRRDGIMPRRQYLEWDGLELEEDRTVAQYGIPNNATIVLTKMRNVGGEYHQRMQDSLVHSLDEADEPRGHDSERRDAPETRSSQTKKPRRSRTRPSSPRKATPRPPLHPPQNYFSSDTDHDDSYAPNRHRQALLNKMRIQSHNGEESSSDNQSTIPPRPLPKPSLPSVKVFVNTIMGFTITVEAKASDSVNRVKKLIEEKEDIPLGKQILVVDGMVLEDQQLLSDYTKEHSLHVLLRMRGGSSSASTTASPSSTKPAIPPKKNDLTVVIGGAPPPSPRPPISPTASGWVPACRTAARAEARSPRSPTNMTRPSWK